MGCSPGTSAGAAEPFDAAATERDSGSGRSLAFDGGADSATGASPPAALKIVSLTTTASVVTGGKPSMAESAGVTFVAIVTDTRGLDSIAGGQLMDEAGHTYAAFGTGANKSTFTATVDFAAINAVSSIDFEGERLDRTFVAKFFDNGGDEAKAAVKLALACRSAEFGLLGACGGKCVDVERDGSNCGACNHACTSGQACVSRTCGALPLSIDGATHCQPRTAAGPQASCQTICVAAGRGCPSSESRLKLYGNQGDKNCIEPSGSYSCTSPVSLGTTYFTCSCR